MKLPETARLLYTEGENYKTVYANGVYGKLLNQGELYLDFFQEFPPDPDEEVYKITEEGKAGEMISREPSGSENHLTLVREKQVRVIISGETAKNFYNWLGNKLGRNET